MFLTISNRVIKIILMFLFIYIIYLIMNRIFPLSVCFYIIQNQGYSIKCLIKKFPAMLEREIWGNTLEDWGISILIILGTIVLMKLISFFSRKVLNPFITRTNNRLDDIIYYSLESPVKFAIMLLGIWIAIHRLLRIVL